MSKNIGLPESPTVPSTAGDPRGPNALTRARRDGFLQAFALHGTIKAAAAQIGINAWTHYDWIKNDQAYANEFTQAKEEFADAIRDEVTRRAIAGWDEPVVYKGMLTGFAVRKYSDRLLELLAKANCPEFRDKIEHKGRMTLEQLIGGCDRTP